MEEAEAQAREMHAEVRHGGAWGGKMHAEVRQCIATRALRITRGRPHIPRPHVSARAKGSQGHRALGSEGEQQHS